jgi:hypothetical protein
MLAPLVLAMLIAQTASTGPQERPLKHASSAPDPVKPLKRRRNGAGKSTTLRVLTGLITPDSAQRVGGRLDERTDPTRFRARLDALIEARFLRCNQGC